MCNILILGMANWHVGRIHFWQFRIGSSAAVHDDGWKNQLLS
jgi:hypothetical protein